MGVQKRDGNFIVNVFNEKCPNCIKGQVFEKDKRIFKIPVMFSKCSVCYYKFEREPGYFIGAMYISYGFAVLQGLITFLVTFYLFPSLSIEWISFFVILAIILCSKKNYKWSRILYIYIFPW